MHLLQLTLSSVLVFYHQFISTVPLLLRTGFPKNFVPDMETGQDDKKFERKIELLKAFMESKDFKKLLSQSKRYLIEG